MTAPVLPDFPWDKLVPYKTRAGQHPGGIVDLSVGTPVDPTPDLVRQALADASDAPGYPQTYGTPPLRQAVVDWFARRRNAPGVDPDGVMPTIGSKELVAWLPLLLGLGAGDVVMHPQVAYPTYDVGARLAGATPLAADGTLQVGPGARSVKLVWLNSPGNPTGRVLGVEHLKKVVDWARSIGAVVASDECYAELGWDGVEVPSLLDPEVCGGSHEGLLVVYSTSKQSNLAGYRAAFVAGDPVLVRRILEIRKHAGMIVPWPVQEALRVALGDDEHVAQQRERYRRRRELMRAWLTSEGFKIDHSEAGLYFWATRDEPCWDTVADLAERGVLVTPGDFYGPTGARHVRVAMTVSDERVAQLAARAAGPDGSVRSAGGNLR
ncbi:succinyldiaminopimelate transaminase [Kineosporia sp. NBRC 101731]|uniref:succinyldiaminopimelate transaminase n=1 Tax=Kineosporia sp. NBRC 101731 TaxID=3032199 RepID=UPI0024A21F53|nr:succinyldiaminopimelate transaminase [Kineosporia sp. NBRC 101731]GLY28545.1 succinyldiaminopimelate transaminase [Kineosporia sp. NBRC 101731]